MLPELPGILKGLQHPLAAEALERLEAGHRLSKAYVDRTKLTDHHAILPTGKTPVARSAAAAAQDLRPGGSALRRGLSAGPAHRGDAGRDRDRRCDLPGARRAGAGSRLEAGRDRRGVRAAKASLRQVRPRPRRMPPRRRRIRGPAAPGQGQELQVDSLEVQEKETQPPRHYDDATLLAAMKNAGREIEDDALAAAMKHPVWARRPRAPRSSRS
jgi:DNA topoisomerase III